MKWLLKNADLLIKLTFFPLIFSKFFRCVVFIYFLNKNCEPVDDCVTKTFKKFSTFFDDQMIYFEIKSNSNGLWSLNRRCYGDVYASLCCFVLNRCSRFKSRRSRSNSFIRCMMLKVKGASWRLGTRLVSLVNIFTLRFGSYPIRAWNAHTC